jgi:hypothetical protein|tara:strand:+ start:2578 stop:2937 length:360 start_codon:yes stop_codon:yes gene_type:complete
MLTREAAKPLTFNYGADMLYATKLTSGETILSQVSDVTNFKLLLIQPLSAEIVDGQLVTMPWPEFLKQPIMDISVHTDNVIFYGPADPEVVDQYERVVALVYQKSDEAEIDEEIGVHFQ